MATCDLRPLDSSDQIGNAAAALGISVDLSRAAYREHSIGFPTDRDTWVRLERRAAEDLHGWNGIEAAGALTEIAKPAWIQAATWRDPDGVFWRADEMELVTEPLLCTEGIMEDTPQLSSHWWSTLNRSLNRLGTYRTRRILLRENDIANRLASFVTVTHLWLLEWTVAHGRTGWGTLTGPDKCWLLDWDHWGMAPRGFDSASLWADSLAVPELADRIWDEREDDLNTFSGRISALYFCALLVNSSDKSDGALVDSAREQAEKLAAQV